MANKAVTSFVDLCLASISQTRERLLFTSNEKQGWRIWISASYWSLCVRSTLMERTNLPAFSAVYEKSLVKRIEFGSVINKPTAQLDCWSAKYSSCHNMKVKNVLRWWPWSLNPISDASWLILPRWINHSLFRSGRPEKPRVRGLSLLRLHRRIDPSRLPRLTN